MYKIVVDLLGADNNCKDLCSGVITAINEIEDLSVIIYAKKEDVLAKFKEENFQSDRVEIIDCKEEVTNLDNPLRAIKTKPDSSLILGLNRAKMDDCDGFVSCGSTGAILVSSMFILNKINNVRPALASVLTGLDNKPVCIMDCGANIDCKVTQLLDFAKMAVAYMKAQGVEHPSVSLLSNGAEEKKGNQVVKEAHELFKTQDFNFVGNIEGKEVLSNKVDVVICDGFSGNVLLKSIEGTAKLVFTEFARYAKLLDKDTQNAFNNAIFNISKKYDYNTEGGALLLGLDKVLVKGHGAANSKTIYSIIKQAYTLSKNNLVARTKEIFNLEN